MLRDGTWSVLFTDLVDSTAQRSRLGDEAADELRREHDRIIVDAVAGNGGEIVKSTGDGFFAAFVGAAEALACAVTIQQQIDLRNRTSTDEAMTLRVGISLGDARVDGGDLYGISVIEAARLCALADGGQILTADVVRVVAGSRATQEFRSVGALELKGIAVPVPASEILWERLSISQDAPPRPPMLDPLTRLAFVGRSEELDRAIDLWKQAAEGGCLLLLVAGEPGIGKTRLAIETARVAHEQGAIALAGRCDDELGVPYQPFVEALKFFVHTSPQDGLREQLGRFPGELVRLVPSIAAQLGDLPSPLRSDPETEQYRLFEAVSSWIAAVSSDRPVLLVLDDLQWAAKPTLQMLRHLLASNDPMRLLVVATYRDTDLDRTHPLSTTLADLRRVPGVDRIALVGLDETGVISLMETTAGHELDEAGLALARAIHAETEGNPFFVSEVLRHLVETGGVIERDGRWTAGGDRAALGIPEGVRDVIGRRLNRLSEHVNETLTLASVIGRGFDLEVLEGVSDLDDDQLLAALDEAITARLLNEVDVGRYRFAHALVRSTLYDELRPTRRARLHQRVGEVIERVHERDLDAHLGELAHHFAQAAAAGDPTAAITYARRAGDHALDQLAHDEAASYHRQALDIFDDRAQPDDHVRAEILVALGTAERRAGIPEHREVLLEAADLAASTGDVDLLVQAALANHRGFFSITGEVDKDRVAVLERALEVVGDAETSERAQLLAHLAAEVVFSETLERRREISEHAVAVAREVDDPAALAQALVARALCVMDPSTVDERLDVTAELIALTNALGDPYLEYFGCWYRFASCFEAGNMGEADELLERQTKLAYEIGQAVPMWQTTFTAAGRALLAGDHASAERLAEEQLALGESAGQPDAMFFYGVLLMELRREQGRLAEIDALVVEAAASSPIAGVEVMAAVVHAELGRLDDARAVLDRVAVANFDDLPHNQAWSSILWGAAVAVVAVGDVDRASHLRRLLGPFETRVIYSGLVCMGSIASHLARLATTCGELDEADRLFDVATRIESGIGAVVLLAETRAAHAATLLARKAPGDTERATSLLAQAAQTANELSLTSLTARVVSLS